MKRFMDITDARRERQSRYNAEHGIVPQPIVKEIRDGLRVYEAEDSVERSVVRESGVEYDVYQAMNEIEREMLEAAEALEFERAAVLRDELLELKKGLEGGKEEES
jgi:excinuclease ABC subunit B